MYAVVIQCKASVKYSNYLRKEELILSKKPSGKWETLNNMIICELSTSVIINEIFKPIIPPSICITTAKKL